MVRTVTDVRNYIQDITMDSWFSLTKKLDTTPIPTTFCDHYFVK